MASDQTLIQISDLSYRPRGASRDVLKGVNLTIRALLLLGTLICKSILTRCPTAPTPTDEGSRWQP
jgi:hypothetical protein